jgi:hypothetical protein
VAGFSHLSGEFEGKSVANSTTPMSVRRTEPHAGLRRRSRDRVGVRPSRNTARAERLKELTSDEQRSATDMVAWLTAGDIPVKVWNLLDTCPTFAGARLVWAFFAPKTGLRSPGRPSQTDLLAEVKVAGGPAVIGVEGKMLSPLPLRLPSNTWCNEVHKMAARLPVLWTAQHSVIRGEHEEGGFLNLWSGVRFTPRAPRWASQTDSQSTTRPCVRGPQEGVHLVGCVPAVDADAGLARRAEGEEWFAGTR